MKKILFNGCSYMAGDELAWEKYCLETKGHIIKWDDFFFRPRSKEDIIFMDYYRFHYRRQHNLPKLIATRLGCEHIDISEDGRSNDDIALTTIAHLLNMSEDERKQIHVCIGWTIVTRFLKYVGKTPEGYKNLYYNLHINHFGNKHNQNELKYIQSFIDESFRSLTDEDFWLNFVKNVILLESFLKCNGITYTFYKALGNAKDSRILGPFSPFNSFIPNSKVTNDENWYNFKILGFNDNAHPYENSSWTTTVIESEDMWIREDNRHPNMKAVTDLSKDLAEFIKKQNVI